MIGFFEQHFRGISGRVFCLGIATLLVAYSAGTPLQRAWAQGWGAVLSGENAYLQDAAFGQTLAKGTISGIRFHDHEAMKVFYARRQGVSLWQNERGLTRDGQALVSTLAQSWSHGLAPERYHYAAIEQKIGARAPADKATLDLLLTDALVRYARDMTGMRVDPARIGQKSTYWHQPVPADRILRDVETARGMESFLNALEPPGQLYPTLRAELKRLMTAPQDDFEHVLPLRFSKRLVFPGERDQAMPALRVRLGLPAVTGHSGMLYDDALASAVMVFQRENYLDPDGIIGPKTLDLLNQSKTQKIQQVIANLERLRWLDRDKPERYIVVNIASQTLWAVERGKVIHDMKVIVGKPARRTREFKTEITGIRFNPDWTIPPGIKRHDIWPKIKADPAFLQDKQIQLYQGVGRDRISLDPASIDWDTLSPRELQAIRMVQPPGDRNPLGRVRVLMPNPYDIYLHDTSHPELFDRAERTQSSGCIRIEKPEEIARFVLAEHPEWHEEKMQTVFRSGKTTDIRIAVSIPVYILYQSVWLDARGQIVYGADIYGRDKDLIQVLKAEGHLPQGGHQGG